MPWCESERYPSDEPSFAREVEMEDSASRVWRDMG